MNIVNFDDECFGDLLNSLSPIFLNLLEILKKEFFDLNSGHACVLGLQEHVLECLEVLVGPYQIVIRLEGFLLDHTMKVLVKTLQVVS